MLEYYSKAMETARINTVFTNITKRYWKIALFCAIHAFIFLIIFKSGIYGDSYKEDFSLLYNYSSWIIDGQLPYLNFAAEYPPLALLFATLPQLLADTQAAYAQLFGLEMLLFDLVGLFVLAALARRLKLSPWKTLSIYTIALLAIGPIITIRYDLIVAITVLLSVYAFVCGNNKTAWALLAIGVMTKLYPIVLAPLYLLHQRRHLSYRQLLVGIGIFALVIAAVVTPALIISPEGYLQSLTYHADRPLQIESTYSSALLLGQSLGLTSVDYIVSHGSLNAVSPLATFFANVSPWVLLVTLALTYWSFNKGSGEGTTKQHSFGPLDRIQASHIIVYSLIVILIFMVTNKVLSPQFIIWLYPLIPVVSGRWRNTTWLLFILIGLLTYFVYPKYYGGIDEGHPLVISILFLRNTSLIILAFLLFWIAKRRNLIGSDT